MSIVTTAARIIRVDAIRIMQAKYGDSARNIWAMIQ